MLCSRRVRVRIRVRIRFGVWLVSVYAHVHVFVLLSVVIVTLLPSATDEDYRTKHVVGRRRISSTRKQCIQAADNVTTVLQYRV